VEALADWWDEDPKSEEFPLKEEWSKGSQQYWKCVLKSEFYADTGMHQLAEIALGLSFFFSLRYAFFFFFLCVFYSFLLFFFFMFHGHRYRRK
jgi:hypothetical protein